MSNLSCPTTESSLMSPRIFSADFLAVVAGRLILSHLGSTSDSWSGSTSI